MDPSLLAISAAMSVLDDEDRGDGNEHSLRSQSREPSTATSELQSSWAYDLSPPSFDYTSSGAVDFPIVKETEHDLGDGPHHRPPPASYEAMMLQHLRFRQQSQPDAPCLRSEPRFGISPYRHVPAPSPSQAFYPPGLAPPPPPPPGPTLLEQQLGPVEELQKQVQQIKHFQELQELLRLQELQRHWKHQNMLSQQQQRQQQQHQEAGFPTFGHPPPYPGHCEQGPFRPPTSSVLPSTSEADDEDLNNFHLYRELEVRRSGSKPMAEDFYDSSSYRFKANNVKASAQRPSKTTRLKCKAIANRAIDLAMETQSPERIQALRDLSAQSPYMHSLLRHTLGVLTSRSTGR